MAGEDKGFDHTLDAVNLEKSDEAPKVYAVRNLKAYVKPPMEEEILTDDGEPAGTGSSAGVGIGVICTCVPVETCVCDTVSYPSASVICPSDGGCPCTSTCSCQSTGGHYWYSN